MADPGSLHRTEDGVPLDGGSQTGRTVSGPSPRKPILGAATFVARRLAFGALVLLCIIFLSYLGLSMAGGVEFGPAARRAFPQAWAYVGRILRGNLGLTTAGSSTALPRPVTEVIAERLPRSLGLLGISLFLASLFGTVLGIVAARGRSQRSQGILLSTLIGVSVPSFYAAFLLQWAVTAYTRQSGQRLLPVAGFGWDRRVVLPALVLAARPLAQITRIAFISVRKELQEDYVRTARGKGLSGGRIMIAHVLRNAAIPILTTISVSLRFSLSSLPVVELYFGWTGAGLMLLKGIAQQDDNLAVALLLCLGTLFILINLVLELIYRLVDPRLWEAPAHVALGERQSLLERARGACDALIDLLTENAVTRWLRRREAKQEPGWSTRPTGNDEQKPTSTRRMARGAVRVAISRNAPLVVGGALVLSLFVIVFLGPELAPNDPYHLQSVATIDGQLASPPFAPGGQYPWGTDYLGRDLMSLLLSGAQQTLALAVLAVTARAVVGVLLGAVAGWANGSNLDRLILSAAEVIASFPTLLLSMLLILALGIRKGVSSFIIALCFVGWGEIMQFVRGEVTALRPRPYIESAVAVGARAPRILARHILPHLFAALIAIVALEMGSVLTLLGELGFISIFIGGGSLIEPIPWVKVLYSDVPEWGALLSNLRQQARSYPWTALYPMSAFFVAILSFNLFGEGVRRLLEEGKLIVHGIVNRYTVSLAVVAVVGLYWLGSHSGSVAFYRHYAEEFDRNRAMAHVAALADPAMQGRALGTPGLDLAAEYIAAEFSAQGLQSAGRAGTYFQEHSRAFERLEAVPAFTIQDGGRTPVYGQDYAPYPGPYVTDGSATAPVRFVGLGKQGPAAQPGAWRYLYPDLVNADFQGEIVLALSDREASLLSWRPKSGLLVVADDPSQLEQRFTFGGRTGRRHSSVDLSYVGEETPRLWISEEMADRLLAGTGYTVAGWYEELNELGMEQVVEVPLQTMASMEVEGVWETKWPVRHVSGLIPGTHGYEFCVDCLGKKLILVLAQYDSPPAGPEGAIYPAANDNASGVALMLETARVINKSGYQPYKTFLFVAYSGEGLEGGEYATEPDVARLLQARSGLSGLELEAIVQLRGVGGGSGRRLEISAGGSLRLAKLFESSARSMGAGVVRAKETIDISVIYQDADTSQQSGQDAPVVRVFWEGWDQRSRLPTDTLENVSAENLEQAGRALALSLMVLGRETNY